MTHRSKKILAIISSTELEGELLVERLSMLFVLATFDHTVQLAFVGDGVLLLSPKADDATVPKTSLQPIKSAASMLQSAQYYDLCPFWLIHNSNGLYHHVPIDPSFDTQHKQIHELSIANFDVVFNW